MLDVAALYERYREQILRYLLRRCGDPELAEDLTQRTFLKAHQRAASYEDRGLPVSAWLYRIAGNLLIDHARRAKLRPAASLQLVGEQAAVTSDAGNDRQVASLELERVLERVLERLASPKQRQVIRLRFLKGMSIAQTSVETGISEDGVKKQQARGLVNLRRLLEAA